MNSEPSKATTRKPPAPAPRLALVQSGELNALNDGIRRLTWPDRCNLFLILTCGAWLFFLPVFAIALFDAWLTQTPLTDIPNLRELFGLSLVGILGIAATDLAIWLECLSPRKLEVSDEGIKFKIYIFVPWKEISQLKMLAVKAQPNLRRLVITYNQTKPQHSKDINIRIPWTKRPIMPRWSIILQKPQADALISEFTTLKQGGIKMPDLIESKDAETDPLKKGAKLVSWLRMMLAILLLLNGFLLCTMAGGMADALTSKSPPAKSKPLNARERKFFRLLRKVFSSPTDMMVATYTAGGTMLVIGAGLFGYCILTDRQKARKDSDEAN